MHKLVQLLLLSAVLSVAVTGFITSRGKELVDKDGNKYFMKGVSLGNYLLPEGYMLGFSKIDSPRLMTQAISEMISPYKAYEFWQNYQYNFIQEADFKLLKNAGFNTVRLPLNSKDF